MVVHCTHGKDRTGLIICLILMLLGLDWKIIEKDYFLSDVELEANKEKRRREMAEKGLGAEFVGCHAGFIPGVVEQIESEGGIEEWLKSIIGMRSAELERIKRNLLA